jgi:hypothetical protein
MLLNMTKQFFKKPQVQYNLCSRCSAGFYDGLLITRNPSELRIHLIQWCDDPLVVGDGLRTYPREVEYVLEIRNYDLYYFPGNPREVG